MPWLVFRSGERLYQVDLGCVEELVTAGRLVRVPRSPGCLLGLTSYGRAAVPVIDLSQVAAARDSAIPAPESLLILRGEQEYWALPVDARNLHVTHDNPQESADPPGESEDRPEFLDPTSTWERVRGNLEHGFRCLAALAQDSLMNSTPVTPGTAAESHHD